MTLVLTLCSCSLLPFIPQRYPVSEVENTLQQAGKNRHQLEEVLRHYCAPADSMQLRAAEYLIANMPGHCFVRIGLYDSTDTEITIDVLAWPDYSALIAAWDSVEAVKGELNWGLAEQVDDLQTIQAAYLIDNIDLAFQAWREKPWAREVSFEDFCEYILPYRGSNEPLDRWRDWFLERYIDLPRLMRDPADPQEAASLINDDIKTWFTFTERFYRHPTDQSFSEMLATGLGRCEDMTNLAIYALRANGLPVTSDYTPHWADTGNNHAWNALLTPTGAIPFMGAESNPGDYRLRGKMAKAYRKSYAEQKDNLYFIKPDWEEVPGWLAGRSYIDVTTQYTPVTDVELELEQPAPDSVDFAYLCVFNSGEWKAIHWSWLQEGKVDFNDMGVDIAYLPMYYATEELIPAGAPFILTEQGDIRPLPGQPGKTVDLRLISTTRRRTVVATDSIEQVFLEVGRVYELFYWQEEWLSLGEQTAGVEPLLFEEVPAGRLYWLVAADSRREERIFTWENGAQKWW